jgi:hypothetical protein
MRLEQIEKLPTILQKIEQIKMENSELRQKIQQLTTENENLKQTIETRISQLENALNEIVKSLGI